MIGCLRPKDVQAAKDRAQLGARLTFCAAMGVLNLLIYRKIVPKIYGAYQTLQGAAYLCPNEFFMQGKIRFICLGNCAAAALWSLGALWFTFRKEEWSDRTMDFLKSLQGCVALWGYNVHLDVNLSGLGDTRIPDSLRKELAEALMLVSPFPGSRHWLLVGAGFMTAGVGACLWATSQLTPAKPREKRTE